jgi:hypothetical protein
MDYNLLGIANIALLALLLLVVISSVILALVMDIRLTVSTRNRSKAETGSDGDGTVEESRPPAAQKAAPTFGRSVLILGSSIETAQQYINDAFEKDFHEIVYSRTEPGVLRERYHFRKNVTFFWITHKEEGDFQISVNDISKISWNLKQVISNLKKAIIFIDCIDYLVFINGFPHVLRLVNEMIDNISKLELSLVIWIDPKAIDEKELTLLRRSMHIIIEEGRVK